MCQNGGGYPKTGWAGGGGGVLRALHLKGSPYRTWLFGSGGFKRLTERPEERRTACGALGTRGIWKSRRVLTPSLGSRSSEAASPTHEAETGHMRLSFRVPLWAKERGLKGGILGVMFQGEISPWLVLFALVNVCLAASKPLLLHQPGMRSFA